MIIKGNSESILMLVERYEVVNIFSDIDTDLYSHKTLEQIMDSFTHILYYSWFKINFRSKWELL